MKVLIINGHPKKKGALDTLVGEVGTGAVEGGAEVEQIRLADQDIGYCRFCLNCHGDLESTIGPCVQDDDMGIILEKARESDGLVLASPMSSGHANAYMKTFIERCTWTLGRPTGRALWIKGCPEPRITDKQRYAVTVTTTGAVPAWSKVLCNGSTREMVELAKYQLNAKVVGKIYVGPLYKRGLDEDDIKNAFKMGFNLAARIRGDGR
ncbi:MAG: flavodoxin family protein [Actinobacteria bacterium]|nr:flavodoxin family protein [Actinomycetota bacterium]MCG2819762.1 flavodoxin family protein [Actinomycetes bacterium]MBU4219266.1 flavodoxin family protein [Actinomycetota bacterium]MBU4359550.1 flavodoxin family protein [Actinomycetota bacterium]MBU4390840.1 flavodoxin family protein [Actinomycetota bacterium]